MSYILDSLKKSDKERRAIDTPTAMVMSAPAFLANDKPQSENKVWIIAFIVIVLLLLAYIIFNYKDAISGLANSSNKPLLLTEQGNAAATTSTVISREKEEAILLYKEALSNKSQPEIDSLYKELNEKGVASFDVTPATTASVAEKTALAGTFSSTSIPQLQEASAQSEVDNTPIAAPALEPVLDAPEVVSEEEQIPSIYQVDAYIRKNIPSIDYGAHIYATDNNSGFVILDGARRRAGDKLDSGLFVEKIKEESVVLSFNGTLFSLPAMKSWEGK